MKITCDNKWRTGLVPLSAREDAGGSASAFYRAWTVFAVTLAVPCVGFGPTIGIREPYLPALRILAAAGFLLALLPVLREALREWRGGTLNVPTLAVALLLVAAALLTLFFDF